jgi:hypothetical protein
MKPLLFESLSPSRSAALWCASGLVVAGATFGILGVSGWARAPADFVLVCRDSVPPIPPPEAGLGSRLEAPVICVAVVATRRVVAKRRRTG